MSSLYGDLPPPETKSKSKSSNNDSSTSLGSSQGQTKISKLYNFTPQVKTTAKPTVKSTVKSLKKPIIPGMNFCYKNIIN